jgi:hypothetical protein
MSLAALSTEPDISTIETLYEDSAALRAMSLTSNYYRALKEQIIYHNTFLARAKDTQIKRLLMILLDRGELAKLAEASRYPQTSRIGTAWYTHGS